MGTHTLHENTLPIDQSTDDMMDNRVLLVEYCVRHELKVLNTLYRKPPHKTATYRKNEELPTNNTPETFSAETHEQLDYIITPRRR